VDDLNPQLYTLKLIAAKHNVSTEAVRLWIVSGELPATKLGRSWIVRPGDLKAFEEKHFANNKWETK
jgi:uncharacterized cupin superfamily protein